MPGAPFTVTAGSTVVVSSAGTVCEGVCVDYTLALGCANGANKSSYAIGMDVAMNVTTGTIDARTGQGSGEDVMLPILTSTTCRCMSAQTCGCRVVRVWKAPAPGPNAVAAAQPHMGNPYRGCPLANLASLAVWVSP